MPSKATYDLTLKLSTDFAEVKKGVDDLKNKQEEYARSSTQQYNKVKSNIVALAGVLVTLKTGLETVKNGMNETGEGADKLEKFTIKLKEGFDSLAKSIVQADFYNMINNWKAAGQAAGDYADSMDLVDDRLKDLSVKRASVASSGSTLRAKQAEGTLTKTEATELKKNTEDLLKIEQQIYDAAIKAQIKFIADKNQLNSDLFSTLENGINQRVTMSEEELNGLEDYVQAYKKFKDETIKANTEIVQSQTTGGGIMGNSGSTTMVVNYQAVNKALEEYLSKQSDVAKLQIFQQSLASGEDYDKLIEFYIKRNNLEGEYAGLLRKTITASQKGSSGTTTISRVEGITPVSTSNLSIPNLANTDYTDRLAAPAQRFEASWVDSMDKVNSQIELLKSGFQSLGDAIMEASEDGKVSFSESMNIMAESAMSLVSVLQALAIAGVIKNEALSKGAIGALTAIAGIASIISLFSKYTKPNRYESGTNYAAGGWSIVGETGEEGMYVPRGARIDNKYKTRNSLALAGEQIVQLKLVGTDLVGAFKLQARSNNSYS
jgi:uncharacterized protein YukE